MAFAQRLQEVRRRSGLTQEQFAERLCVSRQAVSKWESGRGYPEIEKILYICSCYGVTLNELFDQELPPPSESSAPEPEPAPLPTESLHRSLAAFFNNLAPRNKWLAAGILAGVAALAGLIGLCLKGGSSDMATVIWIGAMVLFGVVEAATAGPTSIWFVLGSVAGLIAAICDGPVWLQLTLFFVVSIISLAATRPLVKKLMGKNIVATNADRVLGAQARVTEAIDNTLPTGAVYVGGKTWTARSESGEPIPVGTIVRIGRMEGVKLYVQPLQAAVHTETETETK